MYVQRLRIENIRAIRHLDLSLDEYEQAGWHVILGENGAGKSSVIRALALVLVGSENAHALRQDWSRWIPTNSKEGHIEVTLRQHKEDAWKGKGRQSKGAIRAETTIGIDKSVSKRATIHFSSGNVDRTVHGGGNGWFSASFGPFRRFSGGDPDVERLYLTHPRLAPHLSAFGENVALTECLRWLRELQFRSLEDDSDATAVRDAVVDFINAAGLLPHCSRIEEIRSDEIVVIDGQGRKVAVEELSDGYRSILSLTFELLRQMFVVFGTERTLGAMDSKNGLIDLPGVVAIDEIDAHLHPTWQARIGEWFVQRFPNVQFFVTTHSPIICRAAANGSIWRLPTPGTDDDARRIEGIEFGRLVDGNILDAFGTEFFGEDVTRSAASKDKLMRLARLNRKRLNKKLSGPEQNELTSLQAALPSGSAETAAE